MSDEEYTIPTRIIRHVPLPRKVEHLVSAAVEIITAAVENPTSPIMVPDAVLAERKALCLACEYNDPAGNLGLGECRHPGCGCTQYKLNFAAETCPDTPPKWGKYQP